MKRAISSIGETYKTLGRVATEEGFARLARNGVEVIAESAVTANPADFLIASCLPLFATDTGASTVYHQGAPLRHQPA